MKRITVKMNTVSVINTKKLVTIKKNKNSENVASLYLPTIDITNTHNGKTSHRVKFVHKYSISQHYSFLCTDQDKQLF
jgi:hypothetical protein